jgi:hypothetical protein
VVRQRLNKVILEGMPAADLSVADQVLTRLRRNSRAVLKEEN